MTNFNSMLQAAFSSRRKKILAAAFTLVFIISIWVIAELRPARDARAGAIPLTVDVNPGDGFLLISKRLADAGAIRSKAAFEFLSLFMGSANKLKPGRYALDPTLSAQEILQEIVAGTHKEVSVTIPEGATVYEIEKILADAGVVRRGELVRAVLGQRLEGKLFPDTYRFFTDARIGEVLEKFGANFRDKTESLLRQKNSDPEQALILASLAEKEVPTEADQKIVIGILLKRLKQGIPLQVDATICYAKAAAAYPAPRTCYPLAPLDFKIKSDYNTYLYRGLPPGPIGNPGVSAINAALERENSPYWFYLSDPRTKHTIFSRTLEEQNKNRARYLK